MNKTAKPKKSIKPEENNVRFATLAQVQAYFFPEAQKVEHGSAGKERGKEVADQIISRLHETIDSP